MKSIFLLFLLYQTFVLAMDSSQITGKKRTIEAKDDTQECKPCVSPAQKENAATFIDIQRTCAALAHFYLYANQLERSGQTGKAVSVYRTAYQLGHNLAAINGLLLHIEVLRSFGSSAINDMMKQNLQQDVNHFEKVMEKNKGLS